jgi:ribosomal protein S12
VIPKNGAAIEEHEEGFIEGIRKGLEDFSKGNYIVFEDDDELEAYMMSL